MTTNTDTVFSEELIDKIPIDLIDGVLFICNTYFNNIKRFEKNPNILNEYTAAHATLFHFLKSHDANQGKELDFDIGIDKIKSTVHSIMRSNSATYAGIKNKREAQKSFDNIQAKIASKFGNYILYELSEDQKTNIQSLINELRTKIIDTDLFDETHKQRILGKLEKLQAELHIKMTNFDKIFGFVVEINFLYKNIKEAKPILDLTLKLSDIAFQVIGASNGLPPAATLLQIQ
jgi:hypothetical protein